MTVKRRYRQMAKKEHAGGVASAMRNLDRIMGRVPVQNPACPVDGKPCTSVDCAPDKCRARESAPIGGRADG